MFGTSPLAKLPRLAAIALLPLVLSACFGTGGEQSNSISFTDDRGYTDQPLDRALDYADLLKKIRSPGNGLRDIYRVEMSSLPLPRCVEDATGR